MVLVERALNMSLDKRVPVRGRKLEKLDEESQQEEEFR